MCLQNDFVPFIADAQEIKFTEKLVISSYILSNVGAKAFVSAVWEVIHFNVAGFNLYLENGFQTNCFQSFQTHPPILRGSQDKPF